MAHLATYVLTVLHNAWEYLTEVVAKNWQSALFCACVAQVLEHFGALRVLAKVSLLVVASMASQDSMLTQDLVVDAPVVVTLDSANFISRYAEKSPLDRCTLADDIAHILQKSPRRLAVDFDLSPLLAASPQEQRCQTRLDDLLDNHADQLLLLVPFQAATEALASIKHAWMLARCAKALHFADGAIDQSLGVVTEQVVSAAGAIDTRLAAQLHHGLSAQICDGIIKLDDAQQNPWLSERGGQEASAESVNEPETIALNFPALIKKVAVIGLDTEAFAALPALPNGVVLFGGDWGRDDNFLTTIGPLPGIVVHAARLASLKDPIKTLPPWVGLWGDVVIALCFAWVINRFWEAYVLAVRVDIAFSRDSPHRGKTGFSAFIMMSFVLVFAVLVLYFFVAAEHVFSNWGVLIAPLVIALAIMVDGFVHGPVDQIVELQEGAGQHGGVASQDDLKAKLLPDLRWVSVALLLSAAFFAALCLLPHEAKRFAAWSFALALCVLSLVLLVYVWNLRKRQQHLAAPQIRLVHRLSPRRRTAASSRGALHCFGLISHWLRTLAFWAVLAWGGYLVLSHSLYA